MNQLTANLEEKERRNFDEIKSSGGISVFTQSQGSPYQHKTGV